jgi:hypothetical protein
MPIYEAPFGFDPDEHSDSLISNARPEKLSIRMVTGFAEVIEREEALVAEACNHPNCLVLPFRLELIRVVA